MIATDPDREGEAIAWHIANEIGKTSKPVTRVMFNEITKSAILEAIADPARLTTSWSAHSRPDRVLIKL